MSMKINKLEIENVKRIKAVKVEPKASGLTVIGGNNTRGRLLFWIPLHGRLAGNATNHHRQQERGL